MGRKYWYRYIDTIMSDGKARTAQNVRSNLWDFFSLVKVGGLILCDIFLAFVKSVIIFLNP